MTIGTLIPIDSPEKVMALKPDYLLVLIWYFFQDKKAIIIENLIEF